MAQENFVNIMKRIAYLERDVDLGEYWQLSDEKVTSAVRPQLIEEGIAFYPIDVEITGKDVIILKVKYQCGDRVVCVASQGDTVGAAMTNAHKTALVQAFNIPNGKAGEGGASNRNDALHKAIKKMCPDEGMLNRLAQNMFGKSFDELKDNELQKVGNKIDELKGR